MCEILYRGFHKDENGTEKIFVDDKWVKGEWVYGYYIRYGWTHQEKDYIVPLYASDLYAKEVIPETVGQSTGLTDNNGKKIFEGDIVKIAYCFGWDTEQEKNVTEEEYISKVYSIDGCPFCVDLLHCDGDMSPIAWLGWSYADAEIEVIGNIHNNLELLEGKSK